MLMQMIPSPASGQADFDAFRSDGRAHIRDACGLYPCGENQPRVRFKKIVRLENESRGISREVDDMLV